MTFDDIDEAYERLGYGAGWTFMMTKEARLLDAKVCLVGLNPGGSDDGDESYDRVWSSEQGNAYYCEMWNTSHNKKVLSPLQYQISLLDSLIQQGPDDYFAAQFIPFRSPDLKRLTNSVEAIEFGKKLWTWVLSQSPAKLFLCLGQEAASAIAGLIGSTQAQECFDSGWGEVTIGRYVGTNGRVVVRLPHLSRFQIFGRANGDSDKAIASLAQACRSAD